MATYIELHDLYNNNTLLDRVKIAIAVAAEAIRAEAGATPSHTERLAWAKAALLNLDIEARRMVLVALAQNKALTKAQIDSASDAALQSAIDSAVALVI